MTRSLADYIVGVPAEEKPANPTVGLAFKPFPDNPSRLMDVLQTSRQETDVAVALIAQFDS